ncbi:ATP-binding protein [Synechococcus sp. H55.2]|uniref:sensor histidine kinase n=1 Tax=Synechococcus sp. H55.2 TaxID=2964505 RepID=UPI0039C38902
MLFSSSSPMRLPFLTSRAVPLQVALLLPLLLAVAGGAGGVGYLSWRAGRQMALQLAEHLKSEVNHRTEEHLRRYLQAPLQINALNQGAVQWELLPNLAALQPQDLERLEAYFARQLQQFPELSYIGFVSAEGGFVTARRHTGGSIWTYHTPGLKPGSVQGCQRDPESGDPTGLTRQLGFVDLRRLSWFPEILQQEGARRTWVVSNFFVEFPNQRPERLILTALPLAEAEGRVYGSLVAALSAQQLQAFLEDLQASLAYPGVSWLLDEEGQVVAGREELSPQPLLLAVQEQVGSWATAASEGLLRLRVDGIPYWVQVMAIQDQWGPGFYFVYGIPEGALLAPVYASARQAALLGGGLLLGFLAAGILLSEALSRPLRRLTQIAEQFVHTEILAWPPVDPGPIQEVQTLAKAWQQAATNQQALLDRLWQQQQQYRAVVEQQTELICRSLPDSCIAYANPAYLRFFGRSAEEAIGSRWVDSLPPQEREAVLQSLAALTPEHPYHRSEREYPGEDGQSRWVSWVDQGIFDSQGQLVEILSVGREITEQKRIQQQLEALNRELEAQVALRTAKLQQSLRFEAVLRSLSGQMVAGLKEGEILEEVVKSLAEALNLTGCHIFLTSADGSSWIPACSFPEKADPAYLNDPELRHLLHSHAFLDQPWEVHCCCQKERGGHWVQLLACSLWDKQERLGLLLLERQQEFSEAERQLAYQVANLSALALRQARLYEAAQAQVKELERLNLLKDDFLSTVSHELRTPMTNVRMALQMLQIARDNPEKQQHYFAIALKECNRQIDLINDLLDMQRLAAEKYLLQPEEIFLPRYLRDLVAAVQPLAQAKNQSLQLHLEEGIPPLEADPTALGRILRELLHNAVKYTAPAGSIHLQVAWEGEGILFVCSNSSEIPESELPRIFEKFYRIPQSDRWKHGGTGLGLALVKQLVEHMGGQISVSSLEGWTHFRVWLPQARTASHLQKQRSESSPLPEGEGLGVRESPRERGWG